MNYKNAVHGVMMHTISLNEVNEYVRCIYAVLAYLVTVYATIMLAGMWLNSVNMLLYISLATVPFMAIIAALAKDLRTCWVVNNQLIQSSSPHPITVA